MKQDNLEFEEVRQPADGFPGWFLIKTTLLKRHLLNHIFYKEWNWHDWNDS